jgi:phage gpG-like protein
MTPEEFTRALESKAKEVQSYYVTTFPAMAGNITLRFVNGNFRAQGFQGSTFKKWKPSTGTVLVKSGALRAATYFASQPGQATIRNNMPYAKMHNEGFKGTVNVKAHTRNVYGKTKVGTGKFTKTGKERTVTQTIKKGEGTVKAHTRKVDMPKRQFIPLSENDSPVLNRAIERELTRDLRKLIL